MFLDTSGRPLYPAKVVKTLDWQVTNDSALPSWLTTVGASPVVSFADPSTSRGVCRVTTKVATPTSGDQAGVQTAFNIDFSKFDEVSFVMYSALVNNAASATDHSFLIDMHDAGGGIYLISRFDASGATHFRNYPSATVTTLTWELATTNNYSKRKDVGVTIRPRTGEVFITAGDPYEGAGVIHYTNTGWVNPAATPFIFHTITRTAAQRTLEFSRIKLRLVSN